MGYKPHFKSEHLHWWVGAGAAMLYLAIPAARYNFDGVACAIAVDLGDLRHLVHGNHLAYGILGYLWFSLWKLAGYSGPSLYSLQALSSIFGAAGVGVFLRTLLRLKFRPSLAVLIASGLAVSELYWSWSLESQVYMLGAFFLFAAAEEALRERPGPAKLGMLHAGAVLGHVGHVMFLPAALMSLKEVFGEASLPAWRRYVISLSGTLFAAYLAAAVFCVHPGSLDDVRIWLLGSAALTLDRSFSWHGGYSLKGLLDWLKMSAHLWGGWPAAPIICLGLGSYGAFVAMSEATKGGHVPRRGPIAAFCLLWLGAYAVLFLAWEPSTSVYRITDLAPLWVLMAIGMEATAWRFIWKQSVMAGFVVFLGAWNLTHVVLPGSYPLNNGALQSALWLSRETPENAWIVADGAHRVYVPYFSHRRFIDLRYYPDREQNLEARFKGYQQTGEPVFVLLQSLTAEWQRWFLAHPLKQVSSRGVETLYLLEPSGGR